MCMVGAWSIPKQVKEKFGQYPFYLFGQSKSASLQLIIYRPKNHWSVANILNPPLFLVKSCRQSGLSNQLD